MFCFCSSLAGSVYLLRSVEATEAVGDPGRRHLEKPPYVQARAPGGSVALYLLHVCPRRVSVGTGVVYSLNKCWEGTISKDILQLSTIAMQ